METKAIPGFHGPKLLYWNPPKGRFQSRFLKWLPLKPKVNNFGDVINKIIVKYILEQYYNQCLQYKYFHEKDFCSTRILCIGSILSFAKNGDLIWGAGRNWRVASKRHGFEYLDVRMLRGPRTAEFLETRNITVPNRFGDPGIFISHVLKKRDINLSYYSEKEVSLIPHFSENFDYKGLPVINICGSINIVIRQILSSRFIISSSLHGIIAAESYGIRAQSLFPSKQHVHKFADYYEGTGRYNFRIAKNISQALELGGEELPEIDYGSMLSCFPFDKFRKKY